MTQSDILDVLIAAIILLVALIGFWQGIVRTLLYLCGAFLGSELALWWADDVGDSLADWLPMAMDTGRLVASTVMIITFMVIVGVSFGSLLWQYPNDWRNRAGGLIAGIILGVITIGLIVRYYVLFLQARADAAIGNTNLTWRLWDDFNVIVALSAATLLLMVIAGWVIGPSDQELVAASRESALPAIRTDAGVRESADRPSVETHVREVQRADSLAARPLGSQALNDALFAAPSTNGPPYPEPAVPATTDTDDRNRRAVTSDVIRDDPDLAPHRAAATETVMFAPERRGENLEHGRICPNCGMMLNPGDAFCPDCGFPVES